MSEVRTEDLQLATCKWPEIASKCRHVTTIINPDTTIVHNMMTKETYSAISQTGEKKTPVECAWIPSPMTIACLFVWLPDLKNTGFFFKGKRHFLTNIQPQHTQAAVGAQKDLAAVPATKRKKTRTLRDLASTD